MTNNLQINAKLKRFLTEHKPLKIVLGGRGSGKSIGVSDCMAVFLSQGESVMCLREYLDSIEDSVHKEVVDSVTERAGFDNWTIQQRRVRSPAGGQTTYKGAKTNPNSLKSVKGYKYSWFEEAQTASQDTLEKLLPTILRTNGAECWFTANPQSSNDPFSQKFIVPFLSELERNGFYEDDMHMIAVLNWRDNPWWNNAAEQLRLHDFNNMHRAKYDHIWEGKFNDHVENAIILPEWFDAAVDAHLNPKFANTFQAMGPIVCAHDPFDDGGDAASFVERQGSIIKQVRTKSSGQIDECCDWATNLSRECSADWFVWDGDGMGTGLKRQISDNLKGTKTEFHMFKGSLSGQGQDNAKKIFSPVEGEEQSKGRRYFETFKNNRAQYYVALAERFKATYDAVERGKYIDPENMISLTSDGIDDIVSLRSQLCRIPEKQTPNGLRQILSKADMKKLGIPSPNEADALMMSISAMPQKAAFEEINFVGWS